MYMYMYINVHTYISCKLHRPFVPKIRIHVHMYMYILTSLSLKMIFLKTRRVQEKRELYVHVRGIQT